MQTNLPVDEEHHEHRGKGSSERVARERYSGIRAGSGQVLLDKGDEVVVHPKGSLSEAGRK